MSINKMNDFSFKWKDIAGNYMKTTASDTKNKLDIRGIELREYLNNVIDLINKEGASHLGAKDLNDISKSIQEILTMLLNSDKSKENNLGILNNFKSDISKTINTLEKNCSANDELLLDLKNTFNSLIINAGQSNAEVAAARYDNVSNTSYSKLGDRLDSYKHDILNKITFSHDNTSNVEVPGVDEVLNDIKEKYEDILSYKIPKLQTQIENIDNVKVNRGELNEILVDMADKDYVDSNISNVNSNINNIKAEGIIPTTEDAILGTSNIPFKELFLGDVIKEDNGYTSLANGLIIQWGTNYVDAAELKTITFPKEFNNKCLFFTAYYVGQTLNNSNINGYNLWNTSITKKNSGVRGNASCGFYWLALGY